MEGSAKRAARPTAAPLPPPADDATRAALQALANGEPGDAFALLGPHENGDGSVTVRVLVPGASAVSLIDARHRCLGTADAPTDEGVFEIHLGAPTPYRLSIDWPGGIEDVEDTFGFGPLLSTEVLQRIGQGDGEAIRTALGAHPLAVDGVDGVRFAVWAPNARRVSVVGDFNSWDGRRYPMRLRHDAGVWEIFIPRVAAGARYKYLVTASDGTVLPWKADPLARQSEHPPATASIVAAPDAHAWNDAAWMAGRAAAQAPGAPLSIYEVHAGSWRHDAQGQPLDWDALGAQLVPYVRELGFTHIELLPISEFPFGGSWGYQPTAMYAPTARHGGPEGFARFVDACHQAGIGVLVDWVSAHFPSDGHGLQKFDGTALYEHADPREGFHPDWNTLIYNYGRAEVSGFLIGSALDWLDRFHVDGLRVDAVASMLYRDYSRPDGAWVPNAHGGRENLEAVAFLRALNDAVTARFPGVMVVAEESTAWPGVTAPTAQDGLGFARKWNMGWMHDTLSYMGRDPIHRPYHHSELTFGLVYAFSERFVLPLSHDEVVHGKGSLLGKMPGDAWQKFANLRAYLAFMWAHPGGKLLFMGGEFGQLREWDHDAALDWPLLDVDAHRGIWRTIRDLNALLKSRDALHVDDDMATGFEWSVADDSAQSVLAFLRHPASGTPALLSVSNFTPLPRYDYRIGVPHAGHWREVFNSDSGHYGGSNVGNAGGASTAPIPMHGHAHSLQLTLPPLATVWLAADL